MDYRRAKQIGNLGEARVADIIQASLNPGDQVVHDALFEAAGSTAQIDHIVVDQFGLLLVETKSYTALLKGRSEDAFWTACYRGKRKERVYNPILQNEQHRKKLHALLRDSQVHVPAEYLQSVIVFAEGRIDTLELSDADQARVMTADQFLAHLRTRHEFMPNPGGLTPETIAVYADWLRALNRASSWEVQARHAQTVHAVGGGSRLTHSGSVRRSGGQPAPRPWTRTDRQTVGPRNTHAQRQDVSGRPHPFVLALAAVLIALLTCCCSSMAAVWVRSAVRPSTFVPGATQIPTTSVPAEHYDVPLALSRLQEAAPDVYTAVSNKQSPELSEANGYATYTWEYVEQAGAGAAQVRRISVSLDETGQLAGISGE